MLRSRESISGNPSATPSPNAALHYSQGLHESLREAKKILSFSSSIAKTFGFEKLSDFGKQ